MDSKFKRPHTIGLVVGVFFVLGLVLTGWLVAKHQQTLVSGEPLETWLIQLPVNPVLQPESPAIDAIRKDPGKAIPALAKILNGPPPLRLRFHEALPSSLRQKIKTTAPPSVSTRLFMSPTEWLQGQEKCLEGLSLFPVDFAHEIIPILERALRHPEASLQRLVIRQIREFGPTAHDVAPALENFLNSQDSSLRYESVKTLGAIGTVSSTGLERIISLFQDPSEMTQVAALVAYSHLAVTTDRLPSQLAVTLESESSLVRSATVKAIGRTAYHAPEAVDLLIKSMSDRESHVRRNAALAIARVGPTAAPATDVLIKALWDERMEVRISAAEALGAIGPAAKRAIPHLFDALNNDFAGMGTPAHQAIRKIDPASDRGISAR
jgi:HEAT repeat protein